MQLIVDGKPVTIEGEKNLLEVARRLGIELPTFCYHSELSTYGACRMCLVEIEGGGVQAACSTPPTEGMVIRTQTEKLRRIRRMALELLLANHDRECTSCEKSGHCKLQDISTRMGVRQVRFGQRDEKIPLDMSSPSVVRDPNKCILCGDCVRVCREVQGIGALDFSHRGSRVQVSPAFGKGLNEVDCVACGQCASICPTAALMIKGETDTAWKYLEDPEAVVVAQIAPAVRVAIGEAFGMKSGEIQLGQLAAALRKIGFDYVFDTGFAADLTVMEETTEFLARFQKGERLPQFTSCCPAWVKYTEQSHPELLGNLSSCRSPQQMFASVAKKLMAPEMKIDPSKMKIISIMPCTAKKFEAGREEFGDDVDLVLTTQEIARMIQEAGITFQQLEPEALDMPMGFSSGAGIVFGASGGVSEAVLRAATEMVTGETLGQLDFHQVRGLDYVREATVNLAGTEIRLAVVHTLAKAEELIRRIQSGEVHYDLVEVMACPGGCVGGAGQPLANEVSVRKERAKGIYTAERMMQLRKSQQNPMVRELYQKFLGEPNGHKAHELLHTDYQSRRRIKGEVISLGTAQESKVDVRVCVGTCCYLKGSYDLLQAIRKSLKERGLEEKVSLEATFCFEACGGGPSIMVGERLIGGEEALNPVAVLAAVESALGA